MERLTVSTQLFGVLERIKNHNYPLRALVENYYGIYDLVKNELTSGEEFLALEYISGNYSNDVEIIVIPEYVKEVREHTSLFNSIKEFSSNEASVEELQEFSNIVDFDRFKTAASTLEEWEKYHKYFKMPIVDKL